MPMVPDKWLRELMAKPKEKWTEADKERYKRWVERQNKYCPKCGHKIKGE